MSNGVTKSWGSRKMDEFVAWISQPGKPSDNQPAVDPKKAKEHIDNLLEYIDEVERLAKAGSKDAEELLKVLGPTRALLSAAKTGAEIGEAAKTSSRYLEAYSAELRKREGDKAVLEVGHTLDDTSWQADDQRAIGEARADRQWQNTARRAISYNNPDGTSIPQLYACKVEHDFFQKLMFWEKTHEFAYAPCDSVKYLLRLAR